jgi:serine O-acetyltransferase
MFDNLRADFARARLDRDPYLPPEFAPRVRVLSRTFLPIVSYRYAVWAGRIRVPVLRQLLLIVSYLFSRLTQFLCRIYISPQAEIGPGFVIRSAYGVMIGPLARIGRNCTVESGCVVAGDIGENAYLAPGAKLIALPRLGDGVAVGPNSLVLADVQSNRTVIGVPARFRNAADFPNSGRPGAPANPDFPDSHPKSG